MIMETLRERLYIFIEAKHLNVKQFELRCGLSNGMVSHVTGNIRESTLRKMSNAFPDLNIEWLLTGEGEMLLKDVPMPTDVMQIMGSHNTNSNNIFNYPRNTIDALKAQINILNERIVEKDAQIQEKDSQIRQLLEILKNKQ